MSEKIEVRISRDGRSVVAEALGFQGPACSLATKAIADRFTLVAEEIKPEMEEDGSVLLEAEQ